MALNNDPNTKGAVGCMVLVLYGLLGIVIAVAVGLFFGIGFGFLAYAAYLLISFVIAMLSFFNLGE